MKRFSIVLLALAGLNALSAAAPSDTDFVDVAAAVPGIRVELPYATEANFLRRKIYSSSRCFVRRGTAAKLARAQIALVAQGFGLKVLDGYRPPAAQRLMWRILPDARYVANPSNGSRHQRGAAVDVTLVTASGDDLEMPTAFDDFTPKAASSAPASPAALRHRKLLQQAMTAAGFAILATEWWHFDDTEWRRYPLANMSAEKLEAGAGASPPAQPLPAPTSTVDPATRAAAAETARRLCTTAIEARADIFSARVRPEAGRAIALTQALAGDFAGARTTDDAMGLEIRRPALLRVDRRRRDRRPPQPRRNAAPRCRGERMVGLMISPMIVARVA